LKGWEVVFEGPQFAADVVQASLEAAGIHALTVGSDTAYGPIVQSRVLVPEEEAEAARKIVAETG